MSFHEVSFPYPFEYGMTILHRYKTGIVTTQSLHEERVCNWLDCLREYSVNPIIIDRIDFQSWGAFYRARNGRTHGFRLRDPIDNSMTDNSIGFGDGNRVIWQVYKSYQTNLSGDTYIAKRPLIKLVNPITVKVNDVIRTHVKIDLNSGLLTFAVSLAPINITFHETRKITRNDAGNFITDGVLVNDWLRLEVSDGSIETGRIESFENGGQTVVFALSQGTVPFTRTDTITATVYVPPTPDFLQLAEVKVSCTFDVPVHFTINRLGTTHQTFEQYNPQGVTMMEERIQPVFLDNDNIVETAIPEFVESRYPFHEQISEESEFFSVYNDQMISFDSGYEKRKTRSSQGYNDYAFQYETKPIEEIQRVLAHYHCRKGRFTGFRLRDINDYAVIEEFIGDTDSETYTFQLTKEYNSGGNIEVRTVNKPVQGTVTLFGNDVLLNSVTDHFVINYSTGEVTFTLGIISVEFKNVGSLLSRFTGSWVTDGVQIGDRIIIPESVSNNRLFAVTSVSTLDIGILSVEVGIPVVNEVLTDVTVYIPPLTGTALTWSGEFDVGVRFNTDELQVSIQGFEPYSIDNLGLQEIHKEPITPIYFEKPIPTASPLICASLASPFTSPPAIAVNMATGSLTLTYDESKKAVSVNPFSPFEICQTCRGMTGFTIFTVVSHVQRGVILDISQMRAEPPHNTIADLGIRLLLIDDPADSNKAILELQVWNGSTPFDLVFNPTLNRYDRIAIVQDMRKCTFDTVPLFSLPSSSVYPGTLAIILSFNYEDGIGYLSGSVGDKLISEGPFFERLIEDPDNPGSVKRLPSAGRYVSDTQNGGVLFYPSQVGAYKANISGTIPTGHLQGRMYEFYWAQYYTFFSAGTAEAPIKSIHNSIIRYLEAKYFYKYKASLALEGTRGHFIASYDSLYKFVTIDPVKHTPMNTSDLDLGTKISMWKTEVSGSQRLVDSYATVGGGQFGPQLIAVPVNYQFLEAPLKGFWE